MRSQVFVDRDHAFPGLCGQGFKPSQQAALNSSTVYSESDGTHTWCCDNPIVKPNHAATSPHALLLATACSSPQPTVPTGGAWAYSCRPTLVGANCTATCSAGFIPGSTGAPTATCLASGTWSSSTTGTCVRGEATSGCLWVKHEWHIASAQLHWLSKLPYKWRRSVAGFALVTEGTAYSEVRQTGPTMQCWTVFRKSPQNPDLNSKKITSFLALKLQPSFFDCYS
jgi:hypothetical protein